MKDNCNMVTEDSIKQIIEDSNNQIKLDSISGAFSRQEPDATLTVLDAVDTDTNGLSPNNIKLVKNLIWKYYLVGYQVGKDAHSFKVDPL